MAILTLVDGKKGPNDVLILVTSYNEPLNFAEWMHIGMHYMRSEASYYPISEGNRGPCMILEALIELSHGADFDKVMRRYGLSCKGLKIVDKRKNKITAAKPIERLHEVL